MAMTSVTSTVRRLALVATVVAGLTASGFAFAQGDYPAKPI